MKLRGETHYARCYSLLDASPEDSWQAVRSKHHKQIRKWHPDRFLDSQQRAAAEEKTKELNQAFQMLAAYYEQFGTLPPASSGSHAPLDDYVTRDRAPTPSPPTDIRPASMWEFAEQDTPHSPNRLAHTLLAVVLFSIAVYYFVFFEPGAPDTAGLVAAPVSDEDTITNPPWSPIATGNDMLGKPLPGPETASTAKVGKESFVYPTPGTMTPRATPESSDLRGAAGSPIVSDSKRDAALDHFRKGSTTDQVLALQGSPTRRNQVVWEYGASRVYFHNGRVISWHNDPRNPLKVHP